MKIFFLIGSLLGMSALLMHQLGYHTFDDALRKRNSQEKFYIAIHFLWIHALLLLILGLLDQYLPNTNIALASWLFLIGVLLFSETVIIKSFYSMGRAGILTPIGGLFMISGWMTLIFIFLI